MTDLIDQLKQLKGIRTYTDEKGNFHLTSISEEEEKRRKEEKLGNPCPICNKRSHGHRITPDNKTMCEKCFNKRWEEKESYDGRILSYSVICSYCKTIIDIDNVDEYGNCNGTCNCGAFYEGFNDYDDRGVTFRFYRRKDL